MCFCEGCPFEFEKPWAIFNVPHRARTADFFAHLSSLRGETWAAQQPDEPGGTYYSDIRAPGRVVAGVRILHTRVTV